MSNWKKPHPKNEVFLFLNDMDISLLYDIFLHFPSISIDSRKIEANSIFFALKGENFNGNKFAAKALENGAAYAVIDEKEYKANNRYLLVDDVLTSLQELATYHRKQLNIPILAITGTNGKTTTKELTTAVLSQKYNVLSTKGNLNNHIGVPLTLLSMTKYTEIGVVEMGANHLGEIRQLCEIALPNYGLITNVGKAHLEGFGSFEGVVQTKTEMYRFLEQQNGKIFINTSNHYLIQKASEVQQIGYTTQSGFEGLEGELVQSSPFMVAKIRFPKGWLYCKTQLVGGYNLENVVAAATIGLHFNIDPIKIQQAIETYAPSNNRSQFIKTAKNSILMDAYNANPTSMMAALENFDQYKAQKKAVVLGDMLELGETSQEEHQKIVDQLSTMKIEKVFMVGKKFDSCTRTDHFKTFDTTTQLTEYLQDNQLSDFLILIKGSRGIKLEMILEKI